MPRLRSSRALAAAAVVFLALALSGCCGEDDPAPRREVLRSE
ncbi:MAG TPA: hypothetical protein VHK00_03560 [Miltoncostaeaceae bacterium]|nr:hypothetical protein [Miltoncostaeaceae bacterium]